MTTKRNLDYLSMSLDEIISVKKIEPPKKKHCKLSKWERYNRSDSESEEEQVEELDVPVRAGTTRYYSDDESDDEPVDIPLHRDSDDEDRYQGSGEAESSYLTEGTSDDVVTFGLNGVISDDSSTAAGFLDGRSLLDDEEENLSGQLTFYRGDSTSGGGKQNGMMNRGLYAETGSRFPGQRQPIRYDTGEVHEVITVSDDEEQEQQGGSGVSLQDIIKKAKECFSDSPFFSNATSPAVNCTASYSNSAKTRITSTAGCPANLKMMNLEKYWVKRYQLFSKFDSGIKLDEESWYSVTPEAIAEKIAQRCMIPNGTVVDGFCGCGGNSIQFAKVMKRVIAVDIDPVKIEYARHNARIYGVDHKIQFICGDFMKVGPAIRADMVFLSPPWGGPEYSHVRIFDLRTMIPLDGFKIFEKARVISPNIAYFVPRNTDKDQLMQLAGEGNRVEIEENFLDGRVVTITAYYGHLTHTV